MSITNNYEVPKISRLNYTFSNVYLIYLVACLCLPWIWTNFYYGSLCLSSSLPTFG